jgi:hypothetical protein
MNLGSRRIELGRLREQLQTNGPCHVCAPRRGKIALVLGTEDAEGAFGPYAVDAAELILCQPTRRVKYE